MNSDRLSAYAPYALAALRIIAALLFIAHGTQKLFGFPETQMTPPLMSMFGFAAIIEIVCGLAILVGFQTRIAAFIASGTMAFAYFLVHAPGSFYPTNNGGDAAILFCFVFLYFVFAGAGAFSLDNRGKALRPATA